MITEEPEILCIGNALVDVFAEGEAGAQYGLARPVQHIEIGKLKEILAELPESSMVSGGGAANVAKIAGLLGAKVHFAGAVGSASTMYGSPPDRFAQLFEKELSGAGVKLSLSFKHAPTGICLYLKTGTETRIAASPSAAVELSESDIPEDILQKAAVVVIDGFMLNRPGFVRHILRMAERHGKVSSLDLSSASLAREHAAEILDYARQYPLILFMNEAETEAFYDELKINGLIANGLAPAPPETENNYTFFQSLTAGKPFPVIVEKLGKQGAICFAGGLIHRAETQAVIPQEATGAGDAFSAAFLSAWIQKKALSECAALGNRAARIVLNTVGTQVNRKQLEEIAVLLFREN